MGYRVKGTLKLPDGSPASNAEIEFISRKNFSPLVQELKSNILCGLDGAYDVTLEYGEYAVMVYPGGTYPAALGTITLASDTAAGQDLPTLLQQSGWQPATPEYIQQITAWLAEANASATSSAASASAAKVSETNSKASENAALSSKNSAASSASTAATKAAEAASFASAALASKNAAATSEANALASKNSAATSATTASAGASTATTKASEAVSSASAAKASQDAAKASEANAAASAGAVASAIVTHEGKAGAHPIGGVTGLQAALDGKYSPTNKPTAADVGAIANGAAYLKAETYSRSEADAKLIGKAIGHPKNLGTEDLDTIKTAGVYSQSASVNASAERHYPEGLAGSLVVTYAAGPIQTYHVFNSSRVWTRAQYSTGGWTDWARQYNTLNKPTAADIQNVVSPVSSGGIIERGSNANGEYVKFADGTMICTVITQGTGIPAVIANNDIGAYGWSFYVASLLVTFPVAYILPPSCTAACRGANGGLVSVELPTNTSVRATLWGIALDENNFSVIAIGRWK